MGCNCKDTAKRASKYTNEETIREVHGPEKAAMVISKIFIVIFTILVLIIVTPILILYIIYLLVTGKNINLSKIFKRHGKRKQSIPNQN